MDQVLSYEAKKWQRAEQHTEAVVICPPREEPQSHY